MSGTQKTIVVVTLIAVVILVFAYWVHGHDLATKADAISQAEKQVRSELQPQIDAAIKSQKQAEDAAAKAKADGEAQVKAIRSQQQKPLTSDEIKALIQQAVPGLQPQQVSTPAGPQIELPDTPEARKQIQDAISDCQVCSVERASLQQQLADKQTALDSAATVVAGKQHDLDSLQRENEALKKASKGGNWIQRLGKGVAVIGCAAGGGAIGALLGKTKGAAIGAGGVAAVCEIF